VNAQRFAKKAGELSVLFIVLMVPVIFFTKTNDVFEINKMYVFRLITSFSVFMFLISVLYERRLALMKTALDFPVLALLASSVLSTIFTINHNVSVFGVYEDYEGILTVLNYFFFFYVAVNYGAGKNFSGKVIGIITIATFIVALYGIAQNFHIDFVRWNPETYNPGRFFSTLGNPNFLAAYLVETIPILFILFFVTTNSSRKFTVLAVLLMAVMVLFLTKSRAGYLSIALTVAFIAAYTVYDSRKEGSELFSHNKPWFISFAVIFIVVILFSGKVHEAFMDVADRVARIFTDGIEKTPRTHIFKSAIRMFLDNPVLGKGLDSFQVAFPYYRTAEYWRLEWNGTPEKTHNIFLQYLSTQGIAGLSAYILLIAAFFRKSFDIFTNDRDINKRYMAFGFFMAVIAYFIQGMFNYTVVAYGMMFWLALAMIILMDTGGNRYFVRDFSESEKSFISANRGILVTSLAALSMAFAVIFTVYWAADMYFKIGNVIVDEPGHERDSLHYYGRAVTLNPQREIYWVKYGIAFERSSRAETDMQMRKALVEQAINAHKTTLKLNRMNGYNYNNIARAYKLYAETVDRNAYNDAVINYNEAINRDRNNAYFALDLATIYINSGEMGKAAELAVKYTEIYPDFATPFSYLGYINMLMARQFAGKPEASSYLAEAKKYYEMAVSGKQWFRDLMSMSSTYSNLAIIYFNEGKREKALDTFKKAVTEWPRYKDGYMNLGILYENMGQKENAIEAYRRAAEIDPNDRRPIEKIESLKKGGK